jgi:hypothetical protein
MQLLALYRIQFVRFTESDCVFKPIQEPFKENAEYDSITGVFSRRKKCALGEFH